MSTEQARLSGALEARNKNDKKMFNLMCKQMDQQELERLASERREKRLLKLLWATISAVLMLAGIHVANLTGVF